MNDARQAFATQVRDDPADLAAAASLLALALAPDLAGDAAPGAAVPATLQATRAAVAELAAGVPADGDAADRLRHALGDYRGSTRDYAHLESSLLPVVLRRRRGLPILLSVVWLAVAREVGIPAAGLSIPGRFLVVVGGGDERDLSADVIAGAAELVDPFEGGRRLDLDDVRRLAGGSSDHDPSELLTPAPPVRILERMLRNVQRWADRPERVSTGLAACELALLLPRHDALLRREHAQWLARCGRFVEAAAAYDAFAEVMGDDEAGRDAAGQARMMRARLN